MKRAVDLTVSALALLLLSPVLIAIALVVALTMGRPVLFRQQRAGLHGQPFTIVKFRTMTNSQSPEDGLLPDAERLTRSGSLLRSTSLDELPEFLNVLRGEMSLVGPRPLPMKYLPLYSTRHAHRHDVRPGITGWAQVNGRNATTWEERLDMDVWYVENRSMRLDLATLRRTVGAVLSRDGVSADGHATMPEFRG